MRTSLPSRRTSGRCATEPRHNHAGAGSQALEGRTATLATPYDENGNPQTASLTTYYFGGAYEVTDGAVKKYYAFGGGTVAMRDGNGLQFFLTDHLGSVLAVTDASGALISEQRYLPFGEVRTDVGEITQTDFGYTFQRGLPGTGLMDYRARFYAPALGRFIQPDSIVPGTENPQAWNRYSYTLNNSLSYTDPDGHVSIPIILLAAVKAIFTVVDWGWTGYDTITYIQTAVDPNNSPEVQKEAWDNAVIAVGMELIEPDEALSPIALPVDDVVRHGDDIGDIAEKAPIIIGENMGRVTEYAKRVGGGTIEDFIPRSEWSLEKNKKWINQMMDDGRRILDIGPDFIRRVKNLEAGKIPYSIAYNVERMATKGYDKVEKLFKRFGKWLGEVPGLDY